MSDLLLVLVGLLALWSVGAAGAQPVVDYPVDYRSWQHVKSMIIRPGHPLEEPFGGIHHVYANPSAMTGLSSGHYEDGAVFVFDLLEYVDADNVIVEADRKRLDVMQFGRQRFAATGGWGYATFVAGRATKRLEQDVAESCFACHQSAASQNHVFSKLRP